MKHKQHIPTLNVLLAEDEPGDRYLFEKALQEIPIPTRLIMVNDGEQLMKYLTVLAPYREETDVLFLDLSMPRKNGIECLYEIEQDERLKHLHVVMLTTSCTRGIDFEQNLVTMLISIGAHEYIRKPNDFGQLKTLVHATLTRAIEKKIAIAPVVMEVVA